jgi:hypothetical protein
MATSFPYRARRLLTRAERRFTQRSSAGGGLCPFGRRRGVPGTPNARKLSHGPGLSSGLPVGAGRDLRDEAEFGLVAAYVVHGVVLTARRLEVGQVDVVFPEALSEPRPTALPQEGPAVQDFRAWATPLLDCALWDSAGQNEDVGDQFSPIVLPLRPGQERMGLSRRAERRRGSVAEMMSGIVRAMFQAPSPDLLNPTRTTGPTAQARICAIPSSRTARGISRRCLAAGYAHSHSSPYVLVSM